MKSVCILAVIFSALAISCAPDKPPADWIIVGKVWTANPQYPWAEAFAIKGDSVVAVGTVDEMKAWEGENTGTSTFRKEQLIVPGFIDSHTHFLEGGFNLASVQLRDANTKEEFIKRIKDFAATLPPGTWIQGGDWDHTLWGGELPSRDWIDGFTPNHPVWITRLDGHMTLANSAALRAAGVDESVKDVPGGTIVRSKGRLTGVFKDNARRVVAGKVPPPSPAQEDQALEMAMSYVAERGVTTVHNMTGGMEAIQRAHDSGKLKTRIYEGMRLAEWNELNEKVKQNGFGDKWVRIGLLKGFVDGSLGSHTAAFFKPFEDSPKDSGFFVISEEELYERASQADKAGLHVAIHAIGDRAIHSLLNIFERIEKENGPRDRRFRIEHAQHLAAADIDRFAKLGVIASVQPYHAIDDGRWAEKIIGHERGKTTYAFKTLLDAGAKVVFGSDWFVAPPTPLEGIYAAVTRSTLDGKNPEGWYPEQKISAEQALNAYTIDAAYASFEEKIKGSIEVGKLADFVVLGENLFEIAPEKIREVKIIKTVVGGKPVFELPLDQISLRH